MHVICPTQCTCDTVQGGCVCTCDMAKAVYDGEGVCVCDVAEAVCM